MQIIIVGAGAVGTAICEQLVKEGHNVTVVDSDTSSVAEISASYDVTAVMGSSSDIEVLKQAGAETADMLIAVTQMDEMNILCCYAAKKLGTTHTAARIRNPEYTAFMDLVKDDINVSISINPEYAVAKKISRMLKFPTATKIDTFCDGRVEMAEVTVTEDSPLANLSVLGMREKFNINFLICGVKRGDKAYIPSGKFVVNAGDTLCVTASDEELGKLLKLISKKRKPIKNILVFGGGRTSYYLLKMLGKLLGSTTVIEKDFARCEELSRELGIAVTHGDGTRQELLLEEGIDTADAFLALSDTDEENAIVSMYAKKMGVKTIITMIRSLPYVDFFRDVGIDSIVSPKSSTVDYILRFVRGMAEAGASEIESLHRVLDGKIEAFEFIINESIEGLTDRPLSKVKRTKSSLIAVIVRGDEIIIPSGNDVITKGDRLIVLVTGSINNVKDILS